MSNEDPAGVAAAAAAAEVAMKETVAEAAAVAAAVEVEAPAATEAEAAAAAEAGKVVETAAIAAEEAAKTSTAAEMKAAIHAVEEARDEVKSAAAEVAQDITDERADTIRGRMSTVDVIKFVGLLLFLGLAALLVAKLWPYIGMLFEEGGAEALKEQIHNAGPAGIFIILGVQLLQIIVAVIPGEVVQVAAGMIYGTWGGFAVLLVGCIISSAIVFLLVRKLGAPFVQNMVSTKYLDKFRAFEATGKLDLIVFFLFLIPGLPKDVFTYLVPLTDMPIGRFLVLSTAGRIPAMFMSCFAANGIMEGNYVTSADAHSNRVRMMGRCSFAAMVNAPAISRNR